MKEKVITFLCSLGIPFSALSVGGACNGICGSCQLNCAPGVLALLLLAGKFLYRKYWGRWARA